MTYRLTKIYTRTGDDGKTNLGDANRLDKNAPRLEAIGTLDELNSAIGLIISFGNIPPDIVECVTHIQHTLFHVGGELCPPYHLVIQDTHIKYLEDKIDHWNASLPPLTEFLLPRGTPASAACHLARTICRRAERCLVTLHQHEAINPNALRYINRLSDLLFVISRILTKENHSTEVVWDKAE